MMEILWENIAVLAGALFGFLYGAPRYLQARKPLYASMIVLGTGCTVLGRLYQCVRVLTGYPLTGRFQVGVLGVLGTFAFFFSSNYGQIDSLVDDGGDAFRRYRMIAWTGPALIAVLYLPAVFGPQTAAEKAVGAVVAFVIAAACYYHVKHLFIPDVDYGVVKCLRRFNALALLYGILCMLEMTALAYQSTMLLIAAGGLMTFAIAVIVPVMDKGVRAWRT